MEVKNLFQHITNYQPQTVDIITIFKPFIPEYIPAVGEVDAFLKIPKPNLEAEALGLYQIDEPTLNQTKKSEMDYIIKEFYMGDTQLKNIDKVHSVEKAHKNPKEVQSWIQTVENMQAKKSAPSVIYSNKMPDMDTQLEAWDPDFEKALEEIPWPDPSSNIPIEQWVGFACAQQDIPIHFIQLDKINNKEFY